MKKILLSLVCTAVLLTAPISVLATEIPREEYIDVKAKNAASVEEYCTNLYNGETLTLKDGTSITVQSSSEDDSDLIVSIIPITEEQKEANEYVQERIKNFGENSYAFFVAFYKGREKINPKGKITLHISIPSGYEDAKLYFFSSDGELQEVETERQEVDLLKSERRTDRMPGLTLIFTTEMSGYFAFVLPAATNPPGPVITPEPSVPPEPTVTPGASVAPQGTITPVGGGGNSCGPAAQTKNPDTESSSQVTPTKTLDNEQPIAWLGGMAASVLLIIGIFYKKRIKN